MNGGGAYKMIEIKKVAINIIMYYLQCFYVWYVRTSTRVVSNI